MHVWWGEDWLVWTCPGKWRLGPDGFKDERREKVSLFFLRPFFLFFPFWEGKYFGSKKKGVLWGEKGGKGFTATTKFFAHLICKVFIAASLSFFKKKERGKPKREKFPKKKKKQHEIMQNHGVYAQNVMFM
jgi:hypothetical protein